METKAKQSYDEQPNPPTTEENVRLQSLAAANTLWACLAREVAYGENDSETSVADKIEAVEATIAGKANTSHTHTYGDISGLSVVAATNVFYYRKAGRENVLKIVKGLPKETQEQIDLNQILNKD